jgi:hypothetical protein
MARSAVWSRSLSLWTLAQTFVSLPSPAYGRLIYMVIFMGDRLLSGANPDLHLPPHQNCVL